MKTQVLLALASIAQPQENAGGNGAGKPNWVEISYNDLRAPTNRTDWPTCNTNTDCGEGYVCADHMWAYNTQTESARGCWEFAVCSGNGAFNMFDGRQIQWFCDTYSDAAADGMDPPYGLTRSETAHFPGFTPGCVDNLGCPNG